ncbi:hypothetical protein KKG22_03535 [Patescibacteria group bacterium]|nr:hypothetical protein [Patescibacteria group bacterium]MBU1721222.1 hypothetical protein [Patescibacteria group bacterium]MBU1901070.1 hypothetical protein [Patescibacteria group bacterium]
METIPERQPSSPPADQAPLEPPQKAGTLDQTNRPNYIPNNEKTTPPPIPEAALESDLDIDNIEELPSDFLIREEEQKNTREQTRAAKALLDQIKKEGIPVNEKYVQALGPIMARTRSEQEAAAILDTAEQALIQYRREQSKTQLIREIFTSNLSAEQSKYYQDLLQNPDNFEFVQQQFAYEQSVEGQLEKSKRQLSYLLKLLETKHLSEDNLVVFHTNLESTLSKLKDIDGAEEEVHQYITGQNQLIEQWSHQIENLPQKPTSMQELAVLYNLALGVDGTVVKDSANKKLFKKFMKDPTFVGAYERLRTQASPLVEEPKTFLGRIKKSKIGRGLQALGLLGALAGTARQVDQSFTDLGRDMAKAAATRQARENTPRPDLDQGVTTSGVDFEDITEEGVPMTSVEGPEINIDAVNLPYPREGENYPIRNVFGSSNSRIEPDEHSVTSLRLLDYGPFGSIVTETVTPTKVGTNITPEKTAWLLDPNGQVLDRVDNLSPDGKLPTNFEAALRQMRFQATRARNAADIRAVGDLLEDAIPGDTDFEEAFEGVNPDADPRTSTPESRLSTEVDTPTSTADIDTTTPTTLRQKAVSSGQKISTPAVSSGQKPEVAPNFPETRRQKGDRLPTIHFVRSGDGTPLRKAELNAMKKKAVKELREKHPDLTDDEVQTILDKAEQEYNQ